MNFYRDKIVFTGGSGKFGNVFRTFYPLPNIFFPKKKAYKNHLKIVKSIERLI